MMESMSQTRRIRLQLQAKTTEELIAMKDRLLAVGHDKTDFFELIEEELRKRNE